MLIRALAALLFAGLLALQARAAAALPHRRRAFLLGTGSALCMAAYCASLGLGATSGPLQTALMAAGLLLLLGALGSLVVSLGGKEMGARNERIRQLVREERERRERLERERRRQ